MNDEYLDFDLYPITEEEVISILGNNYKIQNEELVWRCPACPNGDKSGDNLKFNRNKHVLKCFACGFLPVRFNSLPLTSYVLIKKIKGIISYS